MQRHFKGDMALISLLVGIGLILGYIESICFPQGLAYGIKIGISNIVVLFSLMYLGTRKAYLTTIIKVVLSGLLFSSISAAMYSMAGILMSVALMLLIKNKFYPHRVSVIGISIVGSAAFNIGQVVMACFLTKTFATVYMLTYMLPLSIVTGSITGIITNLVLIRLKRGI